ncbi:c-type cytochrome, partial [Pseudomonadota bacterium]
AAQPGDVQRGKSLYENHCMECHTSVVHVREDHKAKSINEIQQFIIRWVNYKKIPWTMEEVQDVLAYINEQYYHYGEKSP